MSQQTLMVPHNMECEIVLGGWRVADVEGTKGGCGLLMVPHNMECAIVPGGWRVADVEGDEGRLWLAGDDELPWIA